VRRRSAVAALVALVLSGSGLTACGLMKRPQIRTFTLTPMPPASAVQTTAAPGVVPLGFSVAELPPGLDRQDVVVRAGEHRLDVRGTDLWSARLGPLVLHTLAVDLSERLPRGGVVLPGQTVPAGGVRSLDLAFAELAAGPEPQVVLDVRWSLAAGGAGAPALTGEERVVEPIDSLDSASVAAGLSRALAALADRLAARLGGFAPPRDAGP
jgi:uncharacterized lipoprotein YmbA